MSLVIATQEFLGTIAATGTDATNITATDRSVTGDTIATSIRNFIGPLVMLAVGLAALVFLFKREMTKFFQFFALAVGVAVFFFAPNFLETVGTFFGSIVGGDGNTVTSDT